MVVRVFLVINEWLVCLGVKKFNVSTIFKVEVKGWRDLGHIEIYPIYYVNIYVLEIGLKPLTKINIVKDSNIRSYSLYSQNW